MDKFDKKRLECAGKVGLKFVGSDAVTNLISEIIPGYNVIKDALSSIYSALKEEFFVDFLLGIAFSYNNGALSEKDVEKLTKKLSNAANNQIVASIIDSVFFSKTKDSRVILGIIAGKYLLTDSLDYADLTLSVALKDLFDDDLKEFGNFYNKKPLATNVDNCTIFIDEYTETQKYIFEKLQNLGLIGRDLAPNRLCDANGFPLRYTLTNVSDRLNKYLSDIK
jgi:hypothetical protein